MYQLFQSEVGVELSEYKEKSVLGKLTTTRRPRYVTNNIAKIPLPTGDMKIQFEREPVTPNPSLELSHDFEIIYNTRNRERQGIQVKSVEMDWKTTYERNEGSKRPSLSITFDGKPSPRIDTLKLRMPANLDNSKLYLRNMLSGSMLGKLIERHCVFSEYSYGDVVVNLKNDDNGVPSLHVMQFGRYEGTNLHYAYIFDKNENKFIAKPVVQPGDRFFLSFPKLVQSEPVTNPAKLTVAEFFQVVDDLACLIPAEQLQNQL